MMHVTFLGAIAWKGSLILVVAFVAAACLRRAPAAARHMLWTAALGALLVLPLAIVVEPQWNMRPAIRTAPAAEHVSDTLVHSAATTAGPEAIHLPPYFWLVLWIMGGSAASVRLAAGTLRARRMLRRSRPASYAEPLLSELLARSGTPRRIKVLETADASVPLACGILTPVIVLPRGASEWSETRLRTVLRHELAHIQRHDLAAQAVGQAACCMYWFHPLVWIAARRLRTEREHACDDVVLTAGVPSDEYAEALVDLARGLASRGQGWTSAPAMAEACDIERRIRGLFDLTRNRGPARAGTAAAIGAVALALLLTVASLSLHGQPVRGAVAGIVQDPSGARVPFCRVVAKNRDGSNQEVTKSDAAGEYRFGAIPPGNYVLEFASAGFASTRLDLLVASGQAARLDVSLEVGTVSEGMTVSGQKPTASARAARTPQRIRVGGNVQPVRLLQQSRPAYPAELQQAGVEGTVAIRAVISVNGDVLSPQVVNTDVDPRLAQLALDAVKQWHYQSALLNGQPVEISTTMTIDFTLENEPRTK